MARMRRDANAAKSGAKRTPIEIPNDFSDANPYSSKCMKDWPSGSWPFLVKRYIELDIAVQVHIQFATSDDAEASNFCLIFECAVRDANLLKSCSGLRWAEVMETCFGDNAGQVKELVPVEVRQTVENGKRIIFGVPVPSLKRLLTLNDSLMLRCQEPNTLLDGGRQVATDGVPKIIPINKDRVLDAVINDLLIISGKLADGVIQGSSLVVEYVANKQAATERRLSSRKSLYDQVAGLRLEIMNNTIRLTSQEPLDCPLQRLEVKYAPFQFPSDSVIGGCHDVYSGHGQGETAQAADSKRTRNPRAQARGVPSRSQEGGEGQALNSAQTEEVAFQTAPAHHSGGYTAKHTHSGSPEDA